MRSSYGGKLTGLDGSGRGGFSDGQLVTCAPTGAKPVTSASTEASECAPHHQRIAFRENLQHQAALRREIRLRDAMQVGHLHVREDLHFAIGRRDVAVNDDRVRELARLAANRFAIDDVVAEELILRALQLALGNRLGAQLVELGDQRLLDLFVRVAGRHQRHREEQIRLFDDVAAAERRQRDALFVDERLIDARAVAVGQNLRRQMQRIRIGVAVPRNRIGDDDGGQRPVLVDRHAALGLRRLLARVFARDDAIGFRDAAEILRHHLLGLRHVEVADDGDRRVARHVEHVVEVAHVLDRGRVEIFHAADRRVLVRADGVEGVVENFRQPAERLIVDSQPPLFLDDLALVLERRLVDAQRRHAIGFHPQHQRQVLRRHRLPEHGRVVVRVGVALPADARQHRRVLFGLDVLRALEHHVLEQMGKAGAAGLLVLRSDVIPELDVHDRRRMIGRQHDREAVRAASSARTAAAAGAPRHRRATTSARAQNATALSSFFGRCEFIICIDALFRS